MDNFNIPKKVNRHVLKAITILTKGDSSCQVPVTQVIAQVKHQMRNLVPVRNIETIIRKSLKNLSDAGVINRITSQRFTMPRPFTVEKPLSSPKTPSTSLTNPKSQKCPVKVTRSQVPVLFPPNEEVPSDSRLNPNARHVCHSTESLSGDEFARTRKRFHANGKQFKFSGRPAVLPRYRVSSQQGSRKQRPQQKRSQQRRSQQKRTQQKRPQKYLSNNYSPATESPIHNCYTCSKCRWFYMNNNFACDNNILMMDFDSDFSNITSESSSNSGPSCTFASLSPISSIKITEIFDVNDVNTNNCITNEKSTDDDDDDGDDMKTTKTDIDIADVTMKENNDETENIKGENSSTSQATVSNLSKSCNTLNPMAKPQQSVSANPVSSTSRFYMN